MIVVSNKQNRMEHFIGGYWEIEQRYRCIRKAFYQIKRTGQGDPKTETRDKV